MVEFAYHYEYGDPILMWIKDDKMRQVVVDLIAQEVDLEIVEEEEE